MQSSRKVAFKVLQCESDEQTKNAQRRFFSSLLFFFFFLNDRTVTAQSRRLAFVLPVLKRSSAI